MSRNSTILLAAGGCLAAVLVIAVAIAVYRVDANDLIAPIKTRIKEATGRDLSIRGTIDLKLSLTPKLVLHDVALANAPWGSAPQMISIKELGVQIALWPLLHSRFEILRVDLLEPVIALETDAQGRANWDLRDASAAAAPKVEATEPTALGVGNVAITKGTLTYRDGKSGAVTKVALDSLTLSARDAQSPVSTRFHGKVDEVAVELAGDLGPFESLVQRRWPYPVALAGEIAGQKANVAAKLRADGDSVHVEELELALGPNVVKGTIIVATGGARLNYNVNLTAPVLTLAHSAMVGAPAKPPTTGAAPAGAAKAATIYLFSEAPLPLAVLRTVDAAGNVAIGRLVVSPTRELTAVDMRFTLRDGHLDVPQLKAASFGGNVDAHVTLAVPASGSPALTLAVDARGLDLGAELAALDVRRDVKGGKTAVKANLRARGTSLHDWAASASGNVTVTTGPATIANAKLNLDSAFDRVAKAANPFREKDPATELKCAVIRLPLAAGIARIDRSVAAETQKIGVSVSGTLDLRNESIDVTFKPQLREGITIDLPQIAELVRLRGPLRNPQVTIDAMASVATVARIGAAVGTVGLSEVAGMLFKAAEHGGSGPCAVALGAPAPTSASSTRTQAGEPSTDPLNKALGKLFGR